jgi:ketosteroid isomerase-like protein
MSEGNVELIRGLFEAWNRGESGLETHHDDAEWDFERWNFDVHGTWRGIARQQDLIARVLGEWEQMSVDADRFIDAGDKVVVFARLQGRIRGSGLEVSDAGTYVFELRDGKVARLALYRDRAEALADAGVEEEAEEEERAAAEPD